MPIDLDKLEKLCKESPPYAFLYMEGEDAKERVARFYLAARKAFPELIAQLRALLEENAQYKREATLLATVKVNCPGCGLEHADASHENTCACDHCASVRWISAHP